MMLLYFSLDKERKRPIERAKMSDKKLKTSNEKFFISDIKRYAEKKFLT